MPFDILAAAIDGPDRVGDLASDQVVRIRVAGAQGDIGLASGQVDRLVAQHELDLQIRMRAWSRFRIPDWFSRKAMAAPTARQPS